MVKKQRMLPIFFFIPILIYKRNDRAAQTQSPTSFKESINNKNKNAVGIRFFTKNDDVIRNRRNFNWMQATKKTRNIKGNRMKHTKNRQTRTKKEIRKETLTTMDERRCIIK